MPKIKIEVRKNSFVVDFDVFVDELGTISQSTFKQEKPGVYSFTREIESVGPFLLVRLTIFGQGSNTQSPSAVCLTFLQASRLNPPVAASIMAGNSAKSAQFHYPVSLQAPSGTLIPDFHDLTPIAYARTAAILKPKGKSKVKKVKKAPSKIQK